MKLLRFLGVLLLCILSPLLLLLSAATLAVIDAGFVLLGRKRLPSVVPTRHDCASVVIPNWNGRDLLEKYLPSIETALAGNPENEIVVVDNGSTDGSAGLLAEKFPGVKCLALPQNLGFGGGSNAGFRAIYRCCNW